jgi:aryl-phospho-beta-D-glucosidase BglC (GH1 family)
MLQNTTKTKDIYYAVNYDLAGLTPIECMDKIIYYSGIQNIPIILNRRSNNNFQFVDLLWYIPGDQYYTEDRFIADWVFLAKRYAGTTVIGADLANEVNSSWIKWKTVAEKAGNAILEINPNWLIFIQGVGTFGSDLRGIRNYPVHLTHPQQLVYSVHDFPTDVMNLTWFNTPYSNLSVSLRHHWDSYFGFVITERIAPLFFGAFGTHIPNPNGTDTYQRTRRSQWLELLLNYTSGQYSEWGVSDVDVSKREKAQSWCYWLLNPVSLPDYGGYFQYNWFLVTDNKKEMLAPFLEPL